MAFSTRSGSSSVASTRRPLLRSRRFNRFAMNLRSQVAGCGAYLPERIVTNHELARRLDTSDEWIRQRTGIGERRVAAAGELTSDLAVRAGERALTNAGVCPSDLDLL